MKLYLNCAVTHLKQNTLSMSSLFTHTHPYMTLFFDKNYRKLINIQCQCQTNRNIITLYIAYKIEQYLHTTSIYIFPPSIQVSTCIVLYIFNPYFNLFPYCNLCWHI